MGKQTNIRLRCTVDNTIYYQWRDVHCIRTVPARVRQTAPTKKEASNFGIAVKYAAIARSVFRPMVAAISPGRSWVYATDGAFRNWLRTAPLDSADPVNGIPFFDGLNFNDAVDFRRIMQVPVQISRGNNGGVVLQWPAFSPVDSFKAPTGTRQIVVKYMAAIMDMQRPGIYNNAKAAFTISYAGTVVPAGTLELENVTGPGKLALVAIAICYYKDDLKIAPIGSLRWNPAGITTSFYN